MTHKAADRVQEVTTTVGTGPYVLSGAVPGFQTWAAGLGDGNSAYYAAQDGTRWEVGEGALSGTTLTRTAILASSSGGAAINWPAGEKKIFLDYPATRSVFVLPSGQLNAAYISMGDAPPANPIVGQMWWESDTGNSFVYYDDGNTKQWVPTNVGVAGGGGGGTIPAGTMAQFDTALTDGNFVFQNGNADLGDVIQTGYNSTGPHILELGTLRAAAGVTGVDFHTSFPGTDYDARVQRGSGANGDFVIANIGSGFLDINQAQTGAIRFKTQSNERVRIDTTGNVGIGTATPASTLHVDNGLITTRRYGAVGGAVILQTAAGTQAAPTAVNAASFIGLLLGRGYDGAAYRDVGTISFESDGAITSTSAPGAIRFATTPAGSVVNVNRMNITSAGDVGIGTAAPQALLHVDNGQLFSQRYGASGSLILRSAGGTQAAPTAIAASTSLGNVAGRGFDGVNYNPVGNITFLSDGAITSTSSPGYIGIATTPAGTVGPLERMRIDSGGNVGIAMVPLVGTSSYFQLGADMALLGDNAQMLQFNAYWNGSWKVKNAGFGGGVRFDSGSGQLQLYTSPASVAANAAAGLVIGAVLDKSNNFSVIGGIYTPALVQCMASGTGFSALNPGGAALTGYIAFGAANSVRTGYIGNASTATGGHMVYANENGGGHVFNNPLYAPSYNPPSDRRLKEHIKPAVLDTGAVFDAIKIVQFDWKRGGKHESLGIVAQDLHEIFPEAVTPADAALDMVGPDGELIENTWSYDLAKMTMLLLAEVKSLRARVAELEAA